MLTPPEILSLLVVLAEDDDVEVVESVSVEPEVDTTGVVICDCVTRDCFTCDCEDRVYANAISINLRSKQQPIPNVNISSDSKCKHGIGMLNVVK